MFNRPAGLRVLIWFIVTNYFNTMLKHNFRRVFGLALAIFMAGSLAVSCYDDSDLRASIDDLKSQLSQLQTLVSTLQNDDAVTGVTKHSDGSYTITFKRGGDVTIKNGENGTNGKDGKDGKDGSIISVTKDDVNHTYVFSFSDGTTLVLPQYSEVRVLTFEDADYKGPEETTAYWSSKIDDPQYGGELLYSPTGYVWLDKNHSFLSGNVQVYDPENYLYGFSSGGIAISNYGNGMFAGASYDRQLEVYNSQLDGAGRAGCGHNGSDNFAVLYDPGEWGEAPCVGFLDNVPRVIESVYVTNICYVLNSLINGDQLAAPMADDGFFFVEAIGTNLGEITGIVRFYLANTRLNVITQWTKWDLSGLGEVTQVDFRIGGSKDMDGEYGFNMPRYVAFDDFAVRVYPD